MAEKNTSKKKLATELAALIPKLDEEGLSFLIRQANVHLYNMEVDRLNAEAEARARIASSGAKRPAKKSASRPARSFSIKHSASAGSYHINFAGGDWKLFTENEMLALVSLAKSKQSAAAAKRACFSWLARERRDALSDWGISGPDDETIAELVKFLKDKFVINRGQKKTSG